MRHLEDYINVKAAVGASSTGGALVGIAVDTTGFSRARFIFQFNNGDATTAAISGNIGIYKATASGGTYALISGAQLTAVSSGVVSATSPVCVIDVPTDASNEWLKVSGNISSTSMSHSAVVELYNGISNPPTSSAQQVVTV